MYLRSVLFCSPNSPIVSNEAVVGLVDRYKVLMPVHHVSIPTILNVDKKLKTKEVFISSANTINCPFGLDVFVNDALSQ